MEPLRALRLRGGAAGLLESPSTLTRPCACSSRHRAGGAKEATFSDLLFPVSSWSNTLDVLQGFSSTDDECRETLDRWTRSVLETTHTVISVREGGRWGTRRGGEGRRLRTRPCSGRAEFPDRLSTAGIVRVAWALARPSCARPRHLCAPAAENCRHGGGRGSEGKGGKRA